MSYVSNLLRLRTTTHQRCNLTTCNGIPSNPHLRNKGISRVQTVIKVYIYIYIKEQIEHVQKKGKNPVRKNPVT